MAFTNLRMLVTSALITTLVLSACSEGKKMSGGVATSAAHKEVVEEKKVDLPAPAPAPAPAPSANQVPVAPTPAPVPAPEPVKVVVTTPDDVVDGQEVFKDCKACFARATELAAKIGFKANKLLFQNLGFYKIEPKYGLCDFHFKKTAFDPIQDHEGKDSILDGQVALYCPCECNAFTF